MLWEEKTWHCPDCSDLALLSRITSAFRTNSLGWCESFRQEKRNDYWLQPALSAQLFFTNTTGGRTNRDHSASVPLAIETYPAAKNKTVPSHLPSLFCIIIQTLTRAKLHHVALESLSSALKTSMLYQLPLLQ